MQISEANIHFSLFSSYIQYSSWIQNHTSSWLEHSFANQDLVQYVNLIMKEMINKHFLDTEVHPCTCSYKNKQEGTTIQMRYCSMHILAQEGSFMTLVNWGGLEPCFTKVHCNGIQKWWEKLISAFSLNVLTNI